MTPPPVDSSAAADKAKRITRAAVGHVRDRATDKAVRMAIPATMASAEVTSVGARVDYDSIETKIAI